MSELSYSKKKRAAFKLSTDPPRKQSVAAYHRHQTLHIGSGSVRSERQSTAVAKLGVDVNIARKAHSARGNGQSQKCKDMLTMVPPLTPIKNLERTHGRIARLLVHDASRICRQSFPSCYISQRCVFNSAQRPRNRIRVGGRLHFISASTIATTVLTPLAEGLLGDPSYGRTYTEVHDACHRYAEHIAPISMAATSVCPAPQDAPILIQPDFSGSPTWLSSSLHRSPADLSTTDPSANDQEKVEDEEVVASWLNLLSKTIDYRLQERRLNRSVLCPQLQRMWSGTGLSSGHTCKLCARSPEPIKRTILTVASLAMRIGPSRISHSGDLSQHLPLSTSTLFSTSSTAWGFYIWRIAHSPPQNKPLFLRIIYSLMFALLDYLGIDLSITYPTNGYSFGRPITVRVDESEYVIDDAGCNVFQSNCLQGRATSCWVVHEPGSDRKLLLKDS
ncbi:hypothetical protein WOLCODRAFT_20899 [Wolfiporia cocos MD-104 SS10]|uniref:Fungal-type protein kinase domain-containing protein n=1 Tax=Wolfiporia cocos (strain MD-104) TaxID=742152 RepID=A0A2H3JH72_WOLCO|nr:hypothetical protein WOLCODRAFT_20899 [Wolfiporia cocos MD-104 SS10]